MYLYSMDLRGNQTRFRVFASCLHNPSIIALHSEMLAISTPRLWEYPLRPSRRILLKGNPVASQPHGKGSRAHARKTDSAVYSLNDDGYECSEGTI
jgi:hypothetical protein